MENPFDEVEFTLTFAENELVKYIRVTVLDDDLPELQEMGMLTMMSNRGADIETDYCTMTVVVKDDEDKLPSEVGFTVTSVEVDQDKSTAELTVRRTGGTNYVLTVPWETMDNTARAGKQYSASSGELVFLGDLTEQTIEIPLIAEAERSEALSFYVVLGGVRGGGEDHLAALGEATAEVKLTSAGKVFQLEDGLNLASVLARGESSSVGDEA